MTAMLDQLTHRLAARLPPDAHAPESPEPDSPEKARLDGLVRRAITVGLLSRLLEENSPSLAIAVAFGRSQGDVLCTSLKSRGIEDVIDLLMQRP